MKRGLLIGVGTLGGLGAVFAITPPQFGTSGPSGLAALPGRATSSSAPVDASPSKAASAPTKSASTSTKPASKPTKSATAPAPGVSGTFDGNTASTRWGPVQVRIVVKDGKIVAASALQSPDGDSRSRSISQQAIP